MLFQAGPRGGRFVNAFAFPAFPRATVLFSTDVLENFTPDELAAVHAHEVAHLEHWTRARLARRTLVIIGLIGAGVFVVPAAAAWLPEQATWVNVAWALGIAVAVPLSLAAHRSHEAESDRRAVALCGDAEALVRALVKLTTLAGLPRRWPLDLERQSSHPSLARRIQAIRRAAGAPAAALPAPVVLPGRDAGRFVLLESARAHWLEGAPEALAGDPDALRLAAGRVRSYAYADLTELHVDVGHGRVRLRAASRSGEKWTEPLRPESMGSAQAALDVVDGQLAPEPAGHAVPLALGTAAASLLVLCALLAGHPLLLAPVGLVALLRTGPVSLAAAGAATVAAAVLRWSRISAAGAPPLLLVCLLLAGVAGLFAAFLLWRDAPVVRRRGARAALGVHGVVAATSAAGLALVASLAHPVRLHQAAAAPAPAAALLGLGTVLLLGTSPKLRLAGVLPVAAAALVVLAGSGPLARELRLDPLLLASHRLEQAAMSLSLIAEQRIDGAGGELRLSPRGTRFAFRAWSDDEDEEAPRLFRVRGDGPPLDLEATDFRFLDETRALVLAPSESSGWELRLLHLDGDSAARWRLAVGAFDQPHLVVETGSGRWRVSGSDRDQEEARVLGGTIDGGTPAEVHFRLPERAPALLAVGERGGVTVRPRLGGAGASRALLPLIFLGSVPSLDYDVGRLTPSGPVPLASTGLHVQCVPPSLDETFFCGSFDGAHTTFWEVGVTDGSLRPCGTVPGQLVLWEAAEGGRLLAWSADLGPMVVELEDSRYRLVPAGGAGGMALALGDRVLGLIRHDGPGSRVAVYRWVR
jgi:hypothetical protein